VVARGAESPRWRVMMLVALACALVALGLGALQLHAEGLSQFL
jgi:hypothetical protein